jgi:predicted kinase
MSAHEFVFMMGLPAAGKSTFVAATFRSSHHVIDPDAIKAMHPEYNPACAFRVHDWSTEVAEVLFNAALAAGGQWLLDGTGSNAEAMVRKMNLARAAGFRVRLVFVKCSLETSLSRAAKRTRKVPVSVITEKARNISTSFNLVAPFADVVEVVEND